MSTAVSEVAAEAPSPYAPQMCAFSGLPKVAGTDWVGHDESRLAEWIVALLAPPSIPKRTEVPVCDACKVVLTSELLEEAAQAAGDFMECNVVRRIR